MIHLEQVRSDTPGCTNHIFLNSAGASLVTTPVFRAVQKYQEMELMLGGYQTVPVFEKEILEFYAQASKLLHCKPGNIAFTFNATDGYSKAVSSIPFRKGDTILTTDDDYISNHILFYSLQKRSGINVDRCDNLPNGDIDLNDMELKIKQLRPVMVSVTHIPSNTGKIQDVVRIGALCQQYDIWYIVDACQSIGQMDVDVQAIQCDFLSATGRKFLRGPRGTGLLYVSDKALHHGLKPLLLDMKGGIWQSESTFTAEPSAIRFELWEKNFANLTGLGEAIKYAIHIGLENIQEYNQVLCTRLKNILLQKSYLRITEEGSRHGSIITFTSEKVSLPEMQQKLNQENIAYSTGMRQFAPIDFNKKNVDWVIRLSPHYFNTTEEIDMLECVL